MIDMILPANLVNTYSSIEEFLSDPRHKRWFQSLYPEYDGFNAHVFGDAVDIITDYFDSLEGFYFIEFDTDGEGIVLVYGIEEGAYFNVNPDFRSINEAALTKELKFEISNFAKSMQSIALEDATTKVRTELYRKKRKAMIETCENKLDSKIFKVIDIVRKSERNYQLDAALTKIVSGCETNYIEYNCANCKYFSESGKNVLCDNPFVDVSFPSGFDGNKFSCANWSEQNDLVF